MKILNEWPPNIKEIRKHFTVHERVLFTYGSTIYNPSGENIPDHLIVHEEVHEKQQGNDPAAWWKKYFTDTEFRIEQEIEAYHAQYVFFAKNTSREESFKFLRALAMALSSAVYGNCISYPAALFKIKQG